MSSDNTIQLKAAGGVLYEKGISPGKILLIKRNGFWDLPKGKLEKNETLEECAVREVEEEIGAKNISIEYFLCETYHEYKVDENKYGKTTYWYSMPFDQSDYEFVPQIKEGITDVKWTDVGLAKQMVEFENLVKVLNAFERQVRKNPG